MSLATCNETKRTGPILSGPIESRELPDWFREQQTAAWKEFESIPPPIRKDPGSSQKTIPRTLREGAASTKPLTPC